MCRFEATVVMEPTFGSGRSVVRCATHGFVMTTPIAEGTKLCPLGQIEQARDEAIAMIREERQGHTELPAFAVPNV